MNWTSIPTITVCQFTFRWLREVSHRQKRKTIRPKRLTARFSRVLSWDSFETKEPTRITAMVSRAADGIRSRSGISRTNGRAV